MRVLIVALCGAALSLPGALPAQSIAVRFTFDTLQASAAEPAAVLAQRQRMRAWQDTVEIYLAQLAPISGLSVAGPEAHANYRAAVVATPIERPGAPGVLLAVVVFEPGSGTLWSYLAHYAAYAPSAREAAGSLIGQTAAAVSRRRS